MIRAWQDVLALLVLVTGVGDDFQETTGERIPMNRVSRVQLRQGVQNVHELRVVEPVGR